MSFTTFSLPFDSLSGPVPIVFYQHGTPGSPDEVLDGFQCDNGVEPISFEKLQIVQVVEPVLDIRV